MDKEKRVMAIAKEVAEAALSGAVDRVHNLSLQDKLILLGLDPEDYAIVLRQQEGADEPLSWKDWLDFAEREK
jgi:hypothetical protein